MQNLLSFILVIGFLIFFHELGHFLIARFFGVTVEKFSIGFGPKIISKKYGETEYVISAIPLGGFVKMFGENPTKQINEDKQKFSFSHKPLFQKFSIVAAGPIFNLLLGLIIIFTLFITIGTHSLKPEVGEVKKNSPAYKAGILKNDIIDSVDNIKIKNWQEISAIINKPNRDKIKLSLIRNNKYIALEMMPQKIESKNIFGEKIDRFIIGITASGATFKNKLGIIDSFSESVKYTYKMTKLTFLSIIKMFQGKLDVKNVGGPIMIAKMAGDKAREGITDLLFFIAILSINLGVLNLLPIPVLDGGHLILFTIEGILRKPLNIKVQGIINQIGMFFLITFMIYVIYNDILKLFK